MRRGEFLGVRRFDAGYAALGSRTRRAYKVSGKTCWPLALSGKGLAQTTALIGMSP